MRLQIAERMHTVVTRLYKDVWLWLIEVTAGKAAGTQITARFI